jgi:hypothetical protein
MQSHKYDTCHTSSAHSCFDWHCCLPCILDLATIPGDESLLRVQESGKATVRCDGRLIMADIGMSAAYGGQIGHGIAVQCVASSGSADSGEEPEATATRHPKQWPQHAVLYGAGVDAEPMIDPLP